MELKLKEVIAREPTLLVMVVGVPNVGKSALINSIHQIAAARFPGKILVSQLISSVEYTFHRYSPDCESDFSKLKLTS